MASLDAQFKRLDNKVTAIAEEITRQFVGDIYTDLLQVGGRGAGGSPYYTGTYLNSHRIGFGQRDTTAAPYIDQQGAYEVPSPDDQLRHFSTWKFGQTIYLTNAVKDDSGKAYARVLEYEGSFGRPPAHLTYKMASKFAVDYMRAGGAQQIKTRVAALFPEPTTPAVLKA